MNIYLRISENQTSLSGEERWNSFDKRLILKKCWISLMLNLGQDDSLKVYYHNVKDKTLKWLDDKHTEGLIEFIQIDSKEESITTPLYHMKESILGNEDNKTVYALLEDDYLWAPRSFKVIKEAFEKWPQFIVPEDDPHSYTTVKEGITFLGKDRHWKTTDNISWNIFGTSLMFKEHIDTFINAGKVFEINMLKDILKENYCINPIPGVATHLKDGHMSPYVAWSDIWEGITIYG